MDPEVQLLLHNISWIISIVVIFGIILFILLNQTKDEATVAVLGIFFFLAIFIISHLLGTNTKNSVLSKQIFMANLANFFIASFVFHMIVAFCDKAKRLRLFIILVHAVALLLAVFFLIFPSFFLLDSIPKMYFPNYYNPGPLNIIRLMFLYGIIFPISLAILVHHYRQSASQEKKNQLKYLALAVIGGHVIGFFPNFLVYNVEIDPLLGAPATLVLSLPFFYGAIKYGLFSVKSLARQAVFFSLAVIFLSGIIFFFNYFDKSIKTVYPSFPSWMLSIFISILIVSFALAIWRKLQEADTMKYEFLTTMTHKLRTPLTGIRWAIENLLAKETKEEVKELLKSIKEENAQLIHLTEALMRISGQSDSSYEYRLEKNDIIKIVEEVLNILAPQINDKKILVEKEYPDTLFIKCDSNMTKFVIQVLIENAIKYSPEKSKITIKITKKSKYVTFSVQDRGMGIAKNDQDKLFTKFFRGNSARLAYTEGIGIGLFMSKEIISKQHGKIWVESEGENKGATFFFSLPLAE